MPILQGPIAEVAKPLGISTQPIYTCRRQDRIDRSHEPGLTSAATNRRPTPSRLDKRRGLA